MGDTRLIPIFIGYDLSPDNNADEHHTFGYFISSGPWIDDSPHAGKPINGVLFLAVFGAVPHELSRMGHLHG
jgi:hypothetical protein